MTEEVQNDVEITGLALTRERYLGVGLGAGAATLVVHVLLFPPGWLWLDAAWAIGWFSAVVATVPGYLGFGPKSGIGGSSAPGLALALRGEVIMFYYGCFESASGSVCSSRPTDPFQYQLYLLGLSVGFVLASASVGYALGAGARRLRDRVQN